MLRINKYYLHIKHVRAPAARLAVTLGRARIAANPDGWNVAAQYVSLMACTAELPRSSPVTRELAARNAV
jgi:hypothetical protein